MRPEFSANRSIEASNERQLSPSENPLEGGLANNFNLGVKHGSREHHLKMFEQKDLSDSFHKYCVEGFVQRYLRRAGFLTVGDMLAFNDTDFQLFINRENQTVQARSLALYKALQLQKSRIVRHHSRNGDNSSSLPALASSTNPPHEVSNGVAACTLSESNLRDRELGFETIDGTPDDLGKLKFTAADPNELLNRPGKDERQSPLELAPIHLGRVFHRDRFNTERKGEYQELPYTEEGLRRHVLIAGSTGSGKTVAARYIIEQAAIAGVPSIVIDAQGDISSLVIEPAQEATALFDRASLLQNPDTSMEEEDLKSKIRKHLNALSKFSGAISGLFAKRCLPRIFTPGRPDLGLTLSLPPYLDILAARGESRAHVGRMGW